MFFIFSIIYGIIRPIDFHIFQRGRSTTFPLIADIEGINGFFFHAPYSHYRHNLGHKDHPSEPSERRRKLTVGFSRNPSIEYGHKGVGEWANITIYIIYMNV